MLSALLFPRKSSLEQVIYFFNILLLGLKGWSKVDILLSAKALEGYNFSRKTKPTGPPAGRVG